MSKILFFARSFRGFGGCNPPLCPKSFFLHAVLGVLEVATPSFIHFSHAVAGADPGFLKGGGLIIKKVVFGALIKYHFGSSRNGASLCAHKLIQV